MGKSFHCFGESSLILPTFKCFGFQEEFVQLEVEEGMSESKEDTAKIAVMILC